jgi:hypothetical protein
MGSSGGGGGGGGAGSLLLNESIIATYVKLSECHFNLALIKHEANELEDALSHYSAAIEAKKHSGGGVFVDATYNLKVCF